MLLSKKIRLIPLILLTLFSSSLYADVVDRVVAVVNDDVITLSEINEEGREIFKNIAAQVSPAERNSKLQEARMAVIEQMIDRKLILQKAAKLNITVSDEEAEAALQQILTNNNATLTQLQAQLAKNEVSEEKYRLNLKNQIAASRLINMEVRAKIIITDQQITDYYNNQYAVKTTEGKYHLLQIGSLIKKDQTGKPIENGKKDALKRIERIRILAMGGNDFKKLANKYSDLPSAVDGGDIGLFTKSEMAPAMWQAIALIKPGEISQVIGTSSGFQLFKLLSSQEGKTLAKAPLETVKQEIQNTLYKKMMKSRHQKWLKTLRDQAYIKVL